MSTIRANSIQGLDAANPAIELPANGTLVVASGFGGTGVSFPVGASGTPSIACSTDTNTGIYFPAADTIGFVEGGNEAVRIDSSSRLLVGTSTARTNLGPDITPLQQVESTSYGSSALSVINNQNTANPSFLILGKSRGTAVGSNTVVQNGDAVGEIRFVAADGSNLQGRPGSISCEIDGAPGAGDLPGRLVFSTTADGASSPTERMRISNAGHITAPYQPAFRAVDNTGITLTAGSVAIFPSTSAADGFNRGGHYSTSTGRFTAPVAGVYHFQACLGTSGWSSTSTTQDHFTLRKNGTAIVYSIKRENATVANTANGYFTDFGSCTVTLSANDYVTVVPTYSNNSFGNPAYTWFEGYLLS